MNMVISTYGDAPNSLAQSHRASSLQLTKAGDTELNTLDPTMRSGPVGRLVGLSLFATSVG